MATKEDIRNLESKLIAEIHQLELKITIKLGVIITLAMGGVATFFKFFVA